MKKKFLVSVEKTEYQTGLVMVFAENSEEAVDQVNDMISIGSLEMSTVEWGDPTYEDNSFKTTGDVD